MEQRVNSRKGQTSHTTISLIIRTKPATPDSVDTPIAYDISLLSCLEFQETSAERNVGDDGKEAGLLPPSHPSPRASLFRRRENLQL